MTINWQVDTHAKLPSTQAYVRDLSECVAQVRGAGATPAWVQVFLPDLGWLEFDPTNGVAESPDLIPIAAARTPDAQPSCHSPLFVCPHPHL